MKRTLFFAALVAMILGGTGIAGAKVVKKAKKKAKRIEIQQGMYTQEGAVRLENGDVANLEMAFIQNLYYEYVFTGTITNESYFRYLKPKFTDEALEMLRDSEGKYNWDAITGKAGENKGFDPANFDVKDLGDKIFEVSGNGAKCYFEVTGGEGAYKINRVSAEPLK